MNVIKNPFVAIFPPFAIGILIGITLNISIPFLSIILLALLIIFAIIEKPIISNHNLLFSWLIIPFFLLLGIYIVDFQKITPPDNSTDTYTFYEGVIVEQPKIKNKSVQTIIKIDAIKDSTEWSEFNTKAVIYIQKDSVAEALKYGDRIVFSCRINKIENAGNPKEFNYKQFMANKSIFYTSYVKKSDYLLIEQNQGNILKRTALNWRNALLNIYEKFNITGQSYGVLSALTLGYRDEVDNETRQIFANTGAMHILAVSGLHVGIIFVILSSLLKFMDKKNLVWLKSLIIILFLWLFAFIAGLSASVTRSALMFSMFVLGKWLQRSTSIYNIIFASAFALLIVNPLNILAVGFQLSYAAVLSIVFFQPYIYKLFAFERFIPDKVWALLSVSIAAQIGTMPIGFYYFHQFPNYFFLTNVLVIPLASIILYLAVILLAISWIPLISNGVAFLLKIVLKLLLVGVKGINSLPFATTKNIYITEYQTIILYIAIFSFMLFWIYNKKELLYTLLISTISFLAIDLNLNYNNLTSNDLIIYNTRNSFTMNILSNKNIVFADDAAFENSNQLDYSCKPFWTFKRTKSPTLLNIDSLLVKDTISDIFITKGNTFFKVGNTKFMIVRNNDIFDKISSQKINIDYVILTKNVYLKIDEILKLIDFKKVIFDASNKYFRTDEWKKQCTDLSIPFHDVATQGAWSINFITGKENNLHIKK